MSIGARVKLAWRYLLKMEPARLRATWAALVLLAGTVGLTVSTALDAKVGAWIGVLAVIVPLLQGESTRAEVMPETRANELIREARLAPPPS